jgi:8-oxo-dGTP pyrophosphatase MutT (NUDIX family)
MTAPTPFAAIEAQDKALLVARFPRLVERCVEVNMNGPGHSFFEEIQAGLTKGRRGEVVMVVRHRDGRLWLHTKSHYPPGVYRLMSGGIRCDEPALIALRRECREELGLAAAEPAGCFGILRYRLERNGAALPFISYFFLIEGGEHEPAVQDATEQITGFRLVWPDELPALAGALRAVPPEWQDWGVFRAVGHEFVAERWGVAG